MQNPKLLPNLKQPPTLTSLNNPDYKTLAKILHPSKPSHFAPCTQSTKPPINHIKTPKPTPPPPNIQTTDYPDDNRFED